MPLGSGPVFPRLFFLLLLTVTSFSAACVKQDTTIDIVFDPCQPVTIGGDSAGSGASDAHRAAIAAATVLWNDVAGTRLDPAPEGDAALPDIPMEFVEAPPGQYGLYDDERGVIRVNDGLESRELTITIAHELGHAMGLVHVDVTERRSVMNPANTETPPGTGDRDALTAIWGACTAR